MLLLIFLTKQVCPAPILVDELVGITIFVGPLPRVRPRNGILALLLLLLVVVVSLRSEFIGEL